MIWMKMDNDFTIERLNRGDERAFEIFYRSNISLYYHFGLRFIDDPQVVQDIVQECFVSVWNKTDGFNDKIHLKNYLYASIRNRCINYLRDRKTEEKSLLKLRELGTEASVQSVAMELEVYDFLCKRIEHLSPMQSEVLWLHIDGYSTEEIARMLNISANTVFTHKQRAKAELKEYLQLLSILSVNFLTL